MLTVVRPFTRLVPFSSEWLIINHVVVGMFASEFSSILVTMAEKPFSLVVENMSFQHHFLSQSQAEAAGTGLDIPVYN